MAKIGFLGGTFNPIHNGHLMLANYAYEQLSLEKVLIVPSGISYLKSRDSVLEKSIRAEMVKLAIEEYPYFEFSDIEIIREGNTYTFETLFELNKVYTNDSIYFICGADTVFSIESWKNPNIVLANCSLAVMVRDDSDIEDISRQCKYLNEKYDTHTEILNAPKVDISSTTIRNMINDGCYESTRKLLPLGVYNYIIENRLYFKGNIDT